MVHGQVMIFCLHAWRMFDAIPSRSSQSVCISVFRIVRKNGVPQMGMFPASKVRRMEEMVRILVRRECSQPPNPLHCHCYRPCREKIAKRLSFPLLMNGR